jgi:hypothetical protein
MASYPRAPHVEGRWLPRPGEEPGLVQLRAALAMPVRSSNGADIVIRKPRPEADEADTAAEAV